MTFKLEKDDPKNPGRSIRAGIATYTYHRAAAVDWKDKESVAKLNSWRQGNLIRQIGPKQKARELWLESERDLLIKILEQHLRTQVVRGRWKKIDWLDVEDRYNAVMKGTKQNTEELTAKRMYPVGKNQKAISESRPLKKARMAPERSGAALRNQVDQFADDRARQLVRDAKDKDAEDLVAGSENIEQVAEAVSDWEVSSDNDSPKPKRQRKNKGKKMNTDKAGSSIKETVEVSGWEALSDNDSSEPKLHRKDEGKKANNAAVKSTTKGADEALEERFDRQIQETMERTRHQNSGDHDENNVGPSFSSSSSRDGPSSFAA